MFNVKTISVRKFKKSDFPIYKQWFEDPELSAHLGPLDKEWLEYILTETSGIQLCFTECDELIAVAGVHFQTESQPHNFITDIAVRPDLRLNGLGYILLTKLLGLPEFSYVAMWRADVMSHNQAAIRLFHKAGWQRITDGEESPLINRELSGQRFNALFHAFFNFGISIGVFR